MTELGVCYYPEHWPEAEWAQDALQMREMGLSWVRIGEFAWSRIEPRPGQFDWDWLDRAVDVLGAAGLNVIMGTPTATPPRWIVDKWPDMLAVDVLGNPRKFGSRRHYCMSHTGYRDEAVRIAQIMGERYGRSPHIKAWQIDNEYGCHDTTLSYSLAARTAFQIWLLEKYDNIHSLNAAWGNVFWSMDYDDFTHIELPNLTVTEPNPAHVMDFRRFSSDQTVRFNAAQCEVLRAHTDMPLIHNYMGRVTDFDHFYVGANLDIASWDSYPLGFLEDRSDQTEGFKRRFMRQGDPDFQAFHHDLYRAVGQGRWWVMEQQPGPVNWAPYNPAPLPGMVRLWSWEAAAHGAEVVAYFRWRQAPFAQEQMHAGLLRPDCVRAIGAGEAAQTGKELRALPPMESKRADVAIVFDYASQWAWETQPQGRSFNYFRLVYDYYRGLRRLGLSVDILPPTATNFGARKLVIIPGLFCWNDNLRAAMDEFNGHLIIGPRTGSKTQNFQTPKTLPPECPGMDVKVTSVETLRPDASIDLKNGGAFQIWREYIETQESVTDRTQGGEPAIIQKNRTYYVAGWPDDNAMNRILTQISAEAGLDVELMPDGVRRRDWGDYCLYMNYGAHIADYKGMTLGPADIALINARSGKGII